MIVIISTMEIRVRNNGAAGNFVEADVLRRQAGCTGYDDAMRDSIRASYGPSQRLHAAQRAPHDRSKFFYAKVVCQASLSQHPVLYRQHGKRRPPGLAGLWIDAGGAGRTKARSDVVHANDKKAIGIHGLAGPDHVVPPPHILGVVRIHSGDVMRRIECMTDQYSIAAF